MTPDVLDFETQMEDAWCAIYEENGISTNKRRAGVRVATPFIDVLWEQGDSLDHQLPLSNGTVEYDYFKGRLTLTVVTHRGTTDSSHADLIRLLRWIMLNRNLTFNHSYYELQDVRPMGSSYNIADGKLDTTEIAYEVVFKIKEHVFS